MLLSCNITDCLMETKLFQFPFVHKCMSQGTFFSQCFGFFYKIKCSFQSPSPSVIMYDIKALGLWNIGSEFYVRTFCSGHSNAVFAKKVHTNVDIMSLYVVYTLIDLHFEAAKIVYRPCMK